MGRVERIVLLSLAVWPLPVICHESTDHPHQDWWWKRAQVKWWEGEREIRVEWESGGEGEGRWLVRGEMGVRSIKIL